MKKPCLYIGPYAEGDFGGGLGINKNKKMLESIFEDRLTKIEFEMGAPLLTKLLRTLRGYTLGLNGKVCRRALENVALDPTGYVFVNSSCYGVVCKKIKRRFPQVNVVTFFHNVEREYVFDVLKRKKRIGNLLTYLVTWYNERFAVRYSDTIIALNRRDSELLYKIYGRRADRFLPVSFEDRFDAARVRETPHVRPRGLFVGSLFFANFYGVKWFVQNVAPFVDADIEIVGKNFETVRTELECLPNVHVIGSVPDMSTYIYDADFIVAPIFEGSGMKLKTVEALMYGKTLFGTSEAFEGYELDTERVGGLCNDARTFIEKINGVKSGAGRFNTYSREVYLERYTDEISATTFRSFFDV